VAVADADPDADPNSDPDADPDADLNANPDADADDVKICKKFLDFGKSRQILQKVVKCHKKSSEVTKSR